MKLSTLSFALTLAFSGLAQAQSQAQATLPASSEPTAFTMSSGTARTQEQLAMLFENADLSLKLDPQTRSVSGNAVLSFKANAELKRLVLELDKNLTIESVSANGKALANEAISNPAGRLFLNLSQPLQKGEIAEVSIRYQVVPRSAKRAPWDGGFVWSQTASGAPWIASAVQGEGCD